MSRNLFSLHALLISVLLHLIGLVSIYLLIRPNSSGRIGSTTEVSLIRIYRRPRRPMTHRLPVLSLDSGSVEVRSPALSFHPSPHPVQIRMSAMSPTYTPAEPRISDSGSVPLSYGGGGGEGKIFALKFKPKRPVVPRVSPHIDALHDFRPLLDPTVELDVPDSPLAYLGERMARQGGDKLDLVLVIDTSESMANDIFYVEMHLEDMLEKLRGGGVDYRIIVVQFRHSLAYSIIGRDVLISRPMRRIDDVKRLLRGIRCRADERALDALWKAANEIEFRPGADRRFVFITDEYVSGKHSSNEVMDLIRRKRIRVDVIGLPDPFQRSIALMTGGSWLPIWKLRD
ncbi:VWA domain-containing protein [Candidatus Poribacteria bacterium]|nr:VWA domain-containing protein [Candidatus Poribacteria bacterium]